MLRLWSRDHVRLCSAQPPRLSAGHKPQTHTRITGTVPPCAVDQWPLTRWPLAPVTDRGRDDFAQAASACDFSAFHRHGLAPAVLAVAVGDLVLVDSLLGHAGAAAEEPAGGGTDCLLRFASWRCNIMAMVPAASLTPEIMRARSGQQPRCHCSLLTAHCHCPLLAATARCPLLAAHCSLPLLAASARCWLLAAGCWLLAAGCWLLTGAAILPAPLSTPAIHTSLGPEVAVADRQQSPCCIRHGGWRTRQISSPVGAAGPRREWRHVACLRGASQDPRCPSH